MYYNIYIYLYQSCITWVVPAVVIHLNYIFPIVQCAESSKFYQQDSPVKLRFLCGEGIRGAHTKSAVHTGLGHRIVHSFLHMYLHALIYSWSFLFIYYMWWYWDVSDLHSTQHVNSRRSSQWCKNCRWCCNDYQSLPHLYFVELLAARTSTFTLPMESTMQGKMCSFWSNHQLR